MVDEFDPVQYVHTELVPLLKELVQLTKAQGAIAEQQYFQVLLTQMEAARDGVHVAEAFLHLSSAAFLGFEYSPDVADLLDTLLERAEHLSEALAESGRIKH
ncbi:MAG: hypothetical protein AAF458_22260 [Pseudomonadota bacterium]